MESQELAAREETIKKLFDVKSYFIGSSGYKEWKVVEKKAGRHYVLTRDRDVLVFRVKISPKLEAVIQVTFNGCPIYNQPVQDFHRLFLQSISDSAFLERVKKSKSLMQKFELLFED